MTDTTLHAGAERIGATYPERASTLAPALIPSAVSWGAIIAGAVAAAALALILLILGTGLGLASVSPFSGEGAGAATFGIAAVAWLTFTQLAASGIGGYLAGRLRTRWASTHVDEVYFRDTAHGFLAWGVATLLTAALLTSVIGTIVGAGAKTAAGTVGGAATAATASAAPMAAEAARSGGGNGGDGGYFVDSLFRQGAGAASGAASMPATSGGSTSSSEGGSSNAEAARILVSGMQAGSLPANDVTYLGQMVSQRTGMSQPDAEKRVNDTFAAMKAKADQAKANAKEAADKARKASTYAALWLFISLLLGAFVASFSATLGGRRRDLV